MSYFYWKYPTCTLKDCGSLAPPTEIEQMRLFLLVEQLLLWKIFVFEILCSLHSLPSPPLSLYLTRPEWGHNMILQQSSQVCVQVSIRFQTHSRWFHWWEQAPLTWERITEISCLVGMKAHVQKTDTGSSEGPYVCCVQFGKIVHLFEEKLTKRSRLWGCLCPTHKSTKS